jgi:hypothetical protein
LIDGVAVDAGRPPTPTPPNRARTRTRGLTGYHPLGPDHDGGAWSGAPRPEPHFSIARARARETMTRPDGTHPPRTDLGAGPGHGGRARTHARSHLRKARSRRGPSTSPPTRLRRRALRRACGRRLPRRALRRGPQKLPYRLPPISIAVASSRFDVDCRLISSQRRMPSSTSVVPHHSPQIIHARTSFARRGLTFSAWLRARNHRPSASAHRTGELQLEILNLTGRRVSRLARKD